MKAILLLLFSKIYPFIITPNEEFQFYSKDLIYQGESFIFGSFTKYCPYCSIAPFGEVFNQQTDKFLLFYIQEVLTNEIIIIHYVKFDQEHNDIYHILKSKISGSYLEKSIKMTKSNYEGIWQGFYIYLQKNTINSIFGYISTTDSQEEIIDISLAENIQYIVVMGGGLQITDNNQIIHMNSFHGKLRLLLDQDIFLDNKDNQKIYFLNIFKQINECSKANDQSTQKIQFKPIQYYEINTQIEQMSEYYYIQFWFKVDQILQTSVEIDFPIITILIENKFAELQLNQLTLFYQITGTDCSIQIQYHNYLYPYFQSNSEIQLNSQSYVIDFKFIQSWHFIKITYQCYSIKLQLENYQIKRQFTQELQDIFQYSSSYQIISLGSETNANYQSTTSAFSFSNCPLSIEIDYCHFSCQTCFGPLKNHCLSCFENSNRVYNNEKNTCSCKLFYLEEGLKSCKGLDSTLFVEEYIYLPSNPAYEQIEIEIICSYGYFYYEGECYQCPSANQANNIYCLNCLQNPYQWAYSDLSCLSIWKHYNDDPESIYGEIMEYDDYYYMFNFQLTLMNYYYLCQEESSICYLKDYDYQNKPLIITCSEFAYYDHGICRQYDYYLQILQSYKRPEGCANYQYGKCAYCYTPKYFLSIINLKCYICYIPHCKYCFQYNIYDHEQVDGKIGTTSHFSKNQEDYAIGCSLCYPNYVYDFSINECVYSKLTLPCINGFYQEKDTFVCTSYKDSFYGILQDKSTCVEIIPFCLKCSKDRFGMIGCIDCIDGYYLDIVNNICYDCKTKFSNVEKCFMISSNGDNWKLEVQSFFFNFLPSQTQLLVLNNYYTFFYGIGKCLDGYDISASKCSLTCESTCLTCDRWDVNNQMMCSKCDYSSREYEVYSFFDNKCQLCPYPCQFCQESTRDEINVINSEFFLNETQKNQTSKCLALLTQKQETYLSMKSFQIQQRDQNGNRFLLKIIEADFSENLFQNSFDNLEVLIRKKIHTYVAKLNSTKYFISTSLKKYIYTLQNMTLINDGINDTYRNQLITFSNYDSLTLVNNKFFEKTNRFLISYYKGIQLFMDNFFYKKFRTSECQITLQNITNLTVSNFTFQNIEIQDSSFIQILEIQNIGRAIFIVIKNLKFIECVFNNSIIFDLLTKNSSYDQLIFDQITFINCTFISSIFYYQNSEYSYTLPQLELFGLQIINSNFMDSTLFNFSLTENNKIQDISLENLTLNNSNMFLVTTSITITNLVTSHSSFQNSSFIKSLSSFQVFLLAFKLENIIFSDIYFEYQSVFQIENQKNIDTILQIVNLTQTNIKSIDTNIFFFSFIGEQIELKDIQTQNLQNMSNIHLKSMSFIVMDCVQISSSKMEPNKLLFLLITDFQSIEISNLKILSQNLSDLYIIGIEQSTNVQNQDQLFINLEYITVLNNYLQKSEINSLVTIFSIQTSTQCLINIKQAQFLNNIILHQIADALTNSPGLMFIDSELSIVSITNSRYKNNSIGNSPQSLQLFLVQNVNIYQTYVENINQNSNINSKLYEIQSFGGFAKLKTQILFITDSYFENIVAQSGGCFYIQLKNDGQVMLSNVTISESFSKATAITLTQGGSLYIDSSDASLNLTIENSVINNSFSNNEGGFLYLIPSRENNNIITFQNILAKNLISLQNSFFNFDCSSVIGFNSFTLNNVKIQIESERVKNFLNISDLANQFLVAQQGFLILINCNISISNFYFQGMAYIPVLYIELSQYFRLQNMFISSSDFYGQNMISILDANYQVQKKLLILIQNVIIQQITFNKYKLLDSTYIPQSYLSIIIKSNLNYIRLQLTQINFNQNQCQACESGIIFIQSTNEQFNVCTDTLEMIKNECGIQSCFVLNLPAAQYINLNQGRLIKNKGGLGGAIQLQVQNLRITNYIFLENQASYQGGAIYLNSSQSAFLNFTQLYFISNQAQYGGALKILNTHFSKQMYLVCCLFVDNSAIEQSNNIDEMPSSLVLEIFGQKIETIRLVSNIKISEQPNLQKYLKLNNKIYIPSGQKISTYQRILKGSFSYLDYSINIKAFSTNSLGEQLLIEENQQCEIIIYSQQSKEKEAIVEYQNKVNFTNSNLNQSFLNLSELTIIIDPYLDSGNKSFSIVCNALESNYQFSFDISIFHCQMGEYYYQNQCLPCEADKGYYSFQKKSLVCQKADPKIISQNTANQVSLVSGYWRPTYFSSKIEYCFKNPSVCLGGWEIHDLSCNKGSIGALCEECDVYNIYGNGQYYKNQNYGCTYCGNFVGKIFFSLITLILMIFSVSLTVNSVFTIFKSFKRLKMASKYYDIIFRRNLDQSAALIKMIVNYFQILVGIHSFRLDMYQNFLEFLLPISNPFASSTFSYDCFISLQYEVEILYSAFLIGLIFPLLCFIAYIVFYLIQVYFHKNTLSTTIYFTALLYLFFYTQPNIIREIGGLLATRTVSSFNYVSKNVSYFYFTQAHLRWVYFVVIPFLLSFAFALPLFLFYILIKNRRYQHNERVRQIWGYLFNDYKKDTFYWEILKVIFRELIIFTLVFIEENVLLKGIIMFLLLLFYYNFAKQQKPYNIGSLNSFEQKNIFICSLVIILSCIKYEVQIKENRGFDFLVQIALLCLLLYFLLLLAIKIIQTYYNKLSPHLDNIRNLIQKRFPLFVGKYKFLKGVLELHKDKQIRISRHINILRRMLRSQKQVQASSLNVSKIVVSEDPNIHTRHISNIFTLNEKHTLINQTADDV